MTEVELWWVGTGAADGGLLDAVRARVSAVYGVPLVVRRPPGPPPDTFDPRRRQHASAGFLRWLARTSRGRVVAITDVDLFMPVLTFVFGEAQLGGRCAVVSTARLSTDGGHRRDVLRARLAREVAHELGHTFGLLHCDHPACAMHRSAALHDVDAKDEELCPDCRQRLRSAREDEERTHDDASAHPDPGGG